MQIRRIFKNTLLQRSLGSRIYYHEKAHFGSKSENKAVVIGGGLAGMTAATLLAKSGVSCTVLEKQPILGG
jgi:heterodisulfide reductase subunit A-like polyferredoxin